MYLYERCGVELGVFLLISLKLSFLLDSCTCIQLFNTERDTCQKQAYHSIWHEKYQTRWCHPHVEVYQTAAIVL